MSTIGATESRRALSAGRRGELRGAKASPQELLAELLESLWEDQLATRGDSTPWGERTTIEDLELFLAQMLIAKRLDDRLRNAPSGLDEKLRRLVRSLNRKLR
jgi:hypothetical protein